MSQRPSRGEVVLFRTPTPSDPYTKAFKTAGFRSFPISVLKDDYQPYTLIDILAKGCDGYEGVVISSKRGAEGWSKTAICIDAVRGRPWSSLPLYAVGQSTLDTLTDSATYSLSPTLWPEQSEKRTAKSAADLIPLIQAHLENQPGSSRRKPGKWLIIRGDKSLDEIPNALRNMGKKVKEVVVYTTSEDPHLKDRLRSRFSVPPEETTWLAFFAPSSAGMVLEHLRALNVDLPTVDIGDQVPGKGKEKEKETNSPAVIKIAAIGETTRNYLQSQGLRVHATAEQPDALGLLEAIENVESIAVEMLKSDKGAVEKRAGEKNGLDKDEPPPPKWNEEKEKAHDVPPAYEP